MSAAGIGYFLWQISHIPPTGAKHPRYTELYLWYFSFFFIYFVRGILFSVSSSAAFGHILFCTGTSLSKEWKNILFRPASANQTNVVQAVFCRAVLLLGRVKLLSLPLLQCIISYQVYIIPGTWYYICFDSIDIFLFMSHDLAACLLCHCSLSPPQPGSIHCTAVVFILHE